MVRGYILSLALFASCADSGRNSQASAEQVITGEKIDAKSAPKNPTASTAHLLQEPSIDANLIPNFHKVNDKIYRSGRPKIEGVNALAKIGFKTILSVQDYGWDKDDLDDEKAWAAAAGIKFLHVPMHGLTKPTLEQIHLALSYLNDASYYPILVHCEKGSDRTGIVVASYHIKTDGWDIAKAKIDMYNYGHSNWLSWWDSILNNI